MRRVRTATIALAAALLGSAALMTAVASVGAQTPQQAPDNTAQTEVLPPSPDLVAEGHELFQEGCSSCHGLDARGIDGVAPDLHGAGAASADFYLSTGRMPLDRPGDQPVRSQPRYPPDQIAAIVAYVGSLGGPPVPEVHPEEGELSAGMQAFTFHCAGCHQIVAKGGVVTGAFAPSLDDSTPTQVAEAVRVGPYLMPDFPRKQIDDKALNSIVRYVELAQDPDDRGGWGIGSIGPIPEGMVAWLMAIAALLLVSRLIGERAR
jgi:quinol---cytochrome-c reductase cytochrome c subunit